MPKLRCAIVAILSIGISGVSQPASAQSDRHSAAESSIEARLRQIQDREEIRALLIDYGRHFDARDFGAYSNLFAQDGTWIGSGSETRFTGPAAIRRMVEEGFPPEFYPGSFHIMTSISVELTGADSATAWSRWTFMVRNDEGTPVPLRAGRYEDVLVRVDGQWKFQQRQVLAD